MSLFNDQKTVKINHDKLFNLMNRKMKLRSVIISPITSLSTSYVFLIIATVVLYKLDFFVQSSFFAWGPPVNVAGNLITDNLTFYILLVIFFFNEIMITWLDTTVYPYIMNEVQNKNVKKTEYNMLTTLSMMFLFYVYSELDMIFIVNGSLSQISFPLSILAGNLLVQFVTTFCYMREKDQIEICDIV